MVCTDGDAAQPDPRRIRRSQADPRAHDRQSMDTTQLQEHRQPLRRPPVPVCTGIRATSWCIRSAARIRLLQDQRSGKMALQHPGHRGPVRRTDRYRRASGRHATWPLPLGDDRRCPQRAPPTSRGPNWSKSGRTRRRWDHGCTARRTKLLRSEAHDALQRAQPSTPRSRRRCAPACRSARVPVAGDQHVVLGADADAAPFRMRPLVSSGRHIQARLDGEHHARLQQARFAVDAVVADVVHVQAEPVPGLVAVEALVVAVGDVLFQRALEQAQPAAGLRSAFAPRRRGRPRTARRAWPAPARRPAPRRPGRAARAAPC